MKNIVRNAFGVVGVIVVLYLLYMFYNDTAIYKKIEGSWVSAENNSEYTFIGKEYTHGTERGTYSIRGNKIRLSTGAEHLVRVTRDYMVLGGEYYLRR